MPLSTKSLAVDTFVPMLGTLPHLFDKGEEHALTTKVDIVALVSAHLAPDM
jgi:hypothetical protein